MAQQIRHTFPGLGQLVTAHNNLKDKMVAQQRLAQADLSTATGAGTSWTAIGFHNDQSEVTITAANASDLATSLTLVNQILAVYKFHMADTLAHKVTGVALASYSAAPDLATAITRANDVKAKFNTHRASTTYHYTADSTNNVTASDATDQSSLNTLLNAIKTAVNAHMASGHPSPSLRLIDA